MPEREQRKSFIAESLMTRQESYNYIGFAFNQAGLTSRDSYISTSLNQFVFLTQSPREESVFVAAVYELQGENHIAHIGYLDPSDRRYLLHRQIESEPKRELVEQAMESYITDERYSIVFFAIKKSEGPR